MKRKGRAGGLTLVTLRINNNKELINRDFAVAAKV